MIRKTSRNTNAVQVKYCSDTPDKIQIEQEAPTIPKRLVTFILFFCFSIIISLFGFVFFLSLVYAKYSLYSQKISIYNFKNKYYAYNVFFVFYCVNFQLFILIISSLLFYPKIISLFEMIIVRVNLK